MRIVTIGLAALLLSAGTAFAGSVQDQIQEEEQPGSEIEVEMDDGRLEAGREGDIRPIEGERVMEDEEAEDAIDVPEDPAFPDEGDPIDDELPGEGPENLSGPLEDDPLPE
jgi:hypothetical protein